MKARRVRSACGLLFLCVVVGSARAQQVSLGGQFQVNSFVPNFQYRPAVAADAAGNFVVVWMSSGSLGSDTVGSIQGQRYDAAGVPLGNEFQVNSYTTGVQRNPAVAVGGGGGFVVVWHSPYGAGSDTSSYSVQGQRYDSAGGTVGTEFQVNSYTTSAQSQAAVAVAADGSFVVTWQSEGSAGTDTSFDSIQARRFDAAGMPLGPDFQVNLYSPDFQQFPAVGFDAADNFVVAWQSVGSPFGDSSGASIHAQRYDAAGGTLGTQFQVNSYTTGNQLVPAIAVGSAGSFVVTWQSDVSAGSDSDGLSIQARRFDAGGLPLAAEFQVNSYTTGNQLNAALALDAADRIVVAWDSDGSAGSDLSFGSVQAQRYDAAGAPLGTEFQVNSYTTNGQVGAAVAASGSGRFVVVWHGFGSPGSDNSLYSVQGQRFAPGLPILGKKFLVKDPTGDEQKRAFVALGSETATDVGASILGDPVTDGATLRVITKGTTDSDQTYVLDAAGWSPAGTVGYIYSGPTGGDGDPVRKVVLKRTPAGKALVKVVLKGNIGTQSLDVVPPNLGDEGGLILTINGGGAYCTLLGGLAGGTEAKDESTIWKLTAASAQDCPAP